MSGSAFGIRLSPQQERQFQQWYQSVSRNYGLAPDPDDPRHYYDYRGPFLEGFVPGPDAHWPSQYKHPLHPNRYVDDVDTLLNRPRTGRKYE